MKALIPFLGKDVVVISTATSTWAQFSIMESINLRMHVLVL